MLDHFDGRADSDIDVAVGDDANLPADPKERRPLLGKRSWFAQTFRHCRSEGERV